MRTGCTLNEIEKMDIDVLVICSAYNQEKYISETLQSFVSQRFKQRFAVLVHDDASTDGTKEIIKRFEGLYPDLIKGVYDSENQYSQGNLFWYKPYLKKTRARYLALCEGDDWWCDQDKLQSQFDCLESTPHSVFCFSNAYFLNDATGEISGLMLPCNEEDAAILNADEILDAEDVIKLEFIPTATFFARVDAWLKEPDLPGAVFRGDRAHQLFLSIQGVSRYIDKPTAVYRVGSAGSMMSSWTINRDARAKSIKRYIGLFEYFDDATHGKYHPILIQQINNRKLSLMFATGDVSILPKRLAFITAKNKGIKYACALILFYVCPSIFNVIWGHCLKNG